MSILSGLVLINGIDIYDLYGAFLSEETKGGRENLKSIYTPSNTKSHVAVNFRENNGEKYPKKLAVVNDARDVELTFCIYAPSKSAWLKQYNAFVAFLKSGDVVLKGNGFDIEDELVEGNGWLNVRFPTIDHELKMFYQTCTSYAPLTYIWKEGVQASHFKVKFREPNPVL